MVTIEEIRRRAAELGLQDVEHMDRTKLIRTIQRKEGHTECYATDWCKAEWKENCAWRADCNADEFFPE